MNTNSQDSFASLSTELLNAPGMIEPSERRLLFEIGFQSDKQPIVEFGAFFGASTLALSSGAKARSSNPQRLICVDSFEVDKGHGFHKHVILHAKHAGKEELLIHSDTKTNWIDVTRSVLGDNLRNTDLIKMVVRDDSDMQFLPNEIGALHLDLPKDALTFSPILKNAFPRLGRNSIIAFQDYAYHFSEELISFFELSMARNIMQPIAIAASTMAFRLTAAETPAPSEWEGILNESVANQKELTDSAIRRYKSIPNSRTTEIVALLGASIRAICSSNEKNSFANQRDISERITEMQTLNQTHSAHVLSEILTEELVSHQ